MVIADSQAGWSLLQEGRWQQAREAFEEALRAERSPESFAGLAQAMWWLGDTARSNEYAEQAFSAFRERGNSIGAAKAAFMLAMNHKCCLGNEAAARGWVAKAETAARSGDSAPIQGWLWSFQGYMEEMRDLRLARELTTQAMDHALVSGDRDLELVCRTQLGSILVRSGQTEDGLRLVDEAMAGLSAGEYSQLDTVPIVCCGMLIACEMSSDLKRASEWSRIADEFIEKFGCPYLHAECRALHGGIQLAIGHWAQAEQELTEAIRLTRDVYPSAFALAVSRLAELRLRQGRVEAAEELLNSIEQELEALLPLAAVKLAQGHAALALALVDRVLRGCDRDSMIAVRALELGAMAHLANGGIALAQDISSQMAAVAGKQLWPEAVARASMMAGRVARAQGEFPTAFGHFERAMQCFNRLGLPLETARARFAIAEMAVASNPELAKVEALGSLEVFDQLGAQRDIDASAALLRALGVPSKPGPKRIGLLTEREQEVLKLLSQGFSNPEIAGRLYISRKTASHHVSNLLAKLAVRNRAEAVALATRMADIS